MLIRVTHEVATVEDMAALIQAAMDAGDLPNPAVNAVHVLACVRVHLQAAGDSRRKLPPLITDAARAYAAVVFRS
jgi:hypothetical protein